MLKQLLNKLESALNADIGQPGQQAGLSLHQAMAGLLSEVAMADHDIDEREKATKRDRICQLLSLDTAQAEQLLDDARQHSEHATSLYEYTDKLRDLDPQARIALIETMWSVAYADENIDPLEEAVIRKTAELLYVDHAEFIRAKLNVIENDDES
ncbi:tellurite resistance TerB family protein [Salinivibrio kushneri]|uniref:tellurite resistance TerB family protein n=1 Tax=Salinivibrio kushneri TaxID=1908198 RepID=UPI0022B340C7|nr:TerB family tellurite resistance protein [Salinivibrio kushneri]WBA12841.1 TerB family tellurite resistance protein [Salinivibrio kushneri]